jgi:hypothetical protein
MRATLMRQRLVPATGTLEADIPRYLDTLEHKPRLASDRKYQLDAWVERFGTRRRHMVTRPEVQQQVKTWERGSVAASTIRHRMTALSQLYRELDGDGDNNPVKGVQRPSEPDPEPDARPVNMIQSVLDALWYRTAMNNRGWPTLARALVLAHTCAPQILHPDSRFGPGTNSTCRRSDRQAGASTILGPCRDVVLPCPPRSAAYCVTSSRLPGWG